MPETGTPRPEPEKQDPPIIKPPESIEPHFDSSKPEAGEWWYTMANSSRFLNSRLGLLTEPPNTTKNWDNWLMKMLHVHERALSKEKLNDQAEDQLYKLKEQGVTPKVAKHVLAETGLSLQIWYDIEVDPKVSEDVKNFWFGNYNGHVGMAGWLGLGVDVAVLEKFYKHIPTVNTKAMKARHDLYYPPFKGDDSDLPPHLNLKDPNDLPDIF